MTDTTINLASLAANWLCALGVVILTARYWASFRGWLLDLIYPNERSHR